MERNKALENRRRRDDTARAASTGDGAATVLTANVPQGTRHRGTTGRQSARGQGDRAAKMKHMHGCVWGVHAWSRHGDVHDDRHWCMSDPTVCCTGRHRTPRGREEFVDLQCHAHHDCDHDGVEGGMRGMCAHAVAPTRGVTWCWSGTGVTSWGVPHTGVSRTVTTLAYLSLPKRPPKMGTPTGGIDTVGGESPALPALVRRPAIGRPRGCGICATHETQRARPPHPLQDDDDENIKYRFDALGRRRTRDHW